MCQKNRSALIFADSARCESLAKSSTLSQTGFWQHGVAAEPPVFPFRRISWGLMALCGALLFATPAVQAEDWMFKRSYFSHLPPEGTPQEAWLPRSRSAYRTAYYQELPSLSFRSELRINNRVIQVGPSTDRSIQAEGFIQIQP